MAYGIDLMHVAILEKAAILSSEAYILRRV
jgi:hypothetical protein